jgi:hypothetical protein
MPSQEELRQRLEALREDKRIMGLVQRYEALRSQGLRPDECYVELARRTGNSATKVREIIERELA